MVNTFTPRTDESARGQSSSTSSPPELPRSGMPLDRARRFVPARSGPPIDATGPHLPSPGQMFGSGN